jgi:rifampicin phosphotransferase
MVLSIENIRLHRTLADLCGGKGKNLFRLQMAGFNVPPLLVLTSDSVLQLLNLPENHVANCISEILHSGGDALQKSEALKKSILAIQPNQQYVDALLKEIEKHLADTERFAVRSSVQFEDSRSASFAGMFNTVLDVQKQDIATAVKSCYASLFDYPLLEYSLKKNISPDSNNIAVVVQKMVDASVSGVIFTMNAAGNYNDLHISAAAGSGEGIVNNTAEVTAYHVNRQNHQVRRNPAEIDVLTQNQLNQLIQTALDIEKEMAYPQDIEFSFDQDGKLFVLQSRPITTIDIHQLKIVDNTNIVESYPGITLPLTFTFARNGYREVFTATARLFGISEKKIESIEDELSHMIRHVKGRVYYNLHNWYKLMQLVLASDNSLKAWETLIGVKSGNSSVGFITFFKKLKATITTLSLLIRYKSIVSDYYRNFEVHYEDFRNWLSQIHQTKPGAKAMFQYYADKSVPLFEKWSATLLNDFFTFRFYDLLKQEVSKSGLTDYETVTNDLLCGMPGVESEQLVIRLLEIKEMIRQNPDYLQIIQSDFVPDTDPLHPFGHFPEDLRNALDAYVAAYGDRTLEELKLETPNFRMHPAGLISLIRLQINGSDSPESVAARQNRMREDAERRMQVYLRNKPLRSIWFGFVLAKARESIRNRENMRLRRTRSYGLVKELFMQIAIRMKEEGVLADERDVFYLTLNELHHYCFTGQSTDIGAKIEAAKAAFAAFDDLELPDRMVFNGEDEPLQNIFHSSPGISGNILHGTAISGGKIMAECIVLHKPDYDAPVEGKILVTRMTDPAWVFLMSRAAGLISEKGSPLSHTAIVGRELGIPVIIAVTDVTKLLQTGMKVQMDCTTGEIEIISNRTT